MTRIYLLLGLLPLYLAGCVYAPALPVSPLPHPDTGAVEIPFETLILEEENNNAQRSLAFEDYLDEPYLVLLTARGEADLLVDFLDSDELEQIRRVNFAQQAVLVLFRGWQPSLLRPVVIERLVCLDDTLQVDAQFWEPGPDMGAPDAESAPFHVVQLPKIGCVAPTTDLELRAHPMSMS